MFRILVLVLCYQQAVSQPVANVPSTRHARELIECCPCPGARNSENWQDAASSQLARARGEDDCPCRGADSEGASSLFFPQALHPDGSHFRTTVPKEDPINLLDPEVALATSMLDTLREVTEEGYRDALEREAAQIAAEPDAFPEESARNVVIVLNPKVSENDDDFISEASHVQESRCIHPKVKTSLSNMRSSANPINILTEPFKLPILKQSVLPHKNLMQFDGNKEVSNVEHSIVDTSGNVLKKLSEPPAFLDTKPLKSLLKLSEPNFKLGNFDENKSIEGLKLSIEPNLKPRTSYIVDDDLSSAPSNVLLQLEPTTDKTRDLFRNDNIPLYLRNLLKLRDVELVPKSILNKSWPKPKLDLSKYAIPTLFKADKNCNTEASNIAYKSEMRDPEQRVNGDANGDNFANIENSEEFQTTGVNLTNESFSIMRADSISNENINDDDENKKVDPSQVQSSIIGTDNAIDSETITAPKSDNVQCSNSLDFKESTKTDHNNLLIDESQLAEFVEMEAVAPETTGSASDVINASDSLYDKDISDSESDSSDTILSTFVPQESRENNKLLDSKPVEKQEENGKMPEIFGVKILEDRNIEPSVKEISPLSATLSNLRESIEKQSENLKKPLTKSALLRMPSANENTNIGNEGQRMIISDFAEIKKNIDLKNTAANEVKNSVPDISMNDLQNMSDKLLLSNLNNRNNEQFIDLTDSDIPDKTTFESKEINIKRDNLLSETKLSPISVEREISEEENACLTSLDAKNTDNVQDSKDNAMKSATQDTPQNEMDTGASDTVISTLPGILDSLDPNLNLHSPLLSDLAMQPRSDPLNFLGKPLGDVLSLNSNVPTLDDLRERLANIFRPNDGSVEFDSSSLEADFTNASPYETMATKASTRKSQKELPMLKQLQDFNNNLIPKKSKILTPLDTLTNSRMPDLKSYRAQLPSSNILDLKPFKIEPRLLNRAEKNKAANKIGYDRAALLKTKPSSTLDTIPTLEELSNTLRSNTRNYLSSPVHSNLNLLSEKLRSHEIEDVAKNIQRNTEKTFKGIQRKLKSSFRTPTSHYPLGDALAKPQDVLEDINDRLKGIHCDLNDRFSTIRENILDSSKIKSILDQHHNSANRNVMSNLRKPKSKSVPSLLQTAASTTSNQQIDPPLVLEPRNNVNLSRNRPQTAHIAAESATNQARVEMPKSVTPSLLSHRTTPFRQNPIVTESLREGSPTPYNRDVAHFKNSNGPLYRPPVSPFTNQRQPNNVIISFGSTTLRPVLPPRPIIRVPNVSAPLFEDVNPQSTDIDEFLNDNASANSRALGKLKSLRTLAPVPSPSDEDFEDTLNNFSTKEIPSTDTKLKSPLIREMSKPNTLHKHSTLHNSNMLKSANTFEDKIDNYRSKFAVKTPYWPKVGKNVLLSNANNAANINKLGNVHNNVKDLRTEQLDMLRSPTETTGIVMDEPLKENVSYRCKMVCTKEIR